MQAIKNWTRGRPGNEARFDFMQKIVQRHAVCFCGEVLIDRTQSPTPSFRPARANFFFGRTFDLDFGGGTMCACAMRYGVRSGLYSHAA